MVPTLVNFHVAGLGPLAKNVLTFNGMAGLKK